MAENKAPRNNAHCTLPGRSGAEHVPLHHRRRQARAAVAGRRASGAAYVVQEAHHHRHGRSAPRPGEVRPHRTAGQQPSRSAARNHSLSPYEDPPRGRRRNRSLQVRGTGAPADAAGPPGAGRDDRGGGGVRPPAHLRRAHRPQSPHRPVRHRKRHRAHRRRAGARIARDRARHGGPDGQTGPRPGGRFPHHPLPGLHRSGGDRSRHERQHVAAPRHPGQPGDAASSAATASWNRAADIWPAG